MRTVLLVGLAALVIGCGGHSEEDWERAQGDIAKLKADLDAANERNTADEQRFAAAQRQIDDLKAKLKGLVASATAPAPPSPRPPTPLPSLPADWVQISKIAING